MHRVVFITAEAKDAERIGKTLVEERLAACVNIVPGVVSYYWWKGKIDRGEEVLMIFKTKTECVEELIRRAKALHPYEVPEIIAFPISEGNPDYIRWIDESVRS